jgi:two-component system, NarL family, response regulator NreC
VNIRVFLADDHAVLRDGLRSLLQATAGMVVVGDADDGRVAVREIQRLKPDVVVMDIAMPEMNGIEAARHVVEQVPGCRVLILSMHSSGEHIHRALRAGASGYVLKESAGKELVTAVRAIHAGRRYLSPKILDTLVENYAQTEGPRGEPSPLERLSEREREVLQFVVEGKSSADIATRLGLSPKTVETYRSRLMQKLGVPNLPALVKFAIQHGLTPL